MTEMLSEPARRRAELLLDRVARRSGLGGGSPSAEAIERKLEPWRRAAASGDAAALARRLAWDAIRPEVAAEVLAGEGDAPAPPPDEKVETWLREVAERARRRADDPRREVSFAQLPFGELVVPWVEAATERLGSVAPGWEESLAPAARLAWTEGLARRLNWLVALPLHSRFARVRAVDGAPGVYSRWVASELGAGWAGIYEEFPRLADQLAGRAADWVAAGAELLSRLAADRDLLARRFGDGVAPGRVEALDPALSDPHARGRRVVALRFASGLAVVYKPRPVALEAWFETVLEWLRDAGLEIAPRAVATLDRGGYGWQERVEPWQATSEEEVERWFRGAGALCALAWLLGGRDLHAENLVAAPGGPALVDGEMLLSPRLAAAAAVPETVEGVLATGLVANPAAPAGPGALGYAGLTAPEPGERSEPDRRWLGLGGDELRLEVASREATILPNVLRREGRSQRVEGYVAPVVDGFERTAAFLAERRAELVAPGGVLDRARGAPTRILFRPSAQYGGVLSLLVRPGYLADGIASGLLLEALLRVFVASVERPLLWPLVAEERAALERLDVPVFRIPVESAALRSESGETIEGWFALSGLEAARERIGRLDAGAIARERESLRRALSPRRRGRANEEGQLLAAASAMAAALATAPGFAAAPRAGAGLRELSLYGGASGRALFAAGAFRATGEEAWRAVAGRLGSAVLEALGSSREVDPDRDRPGGTDGWGSLIWTFVMLAELLGDPRWLEGARGAAAALDRTPSLPERWGWDVAAGEAGAILGLLALAEAGDAGALESATRRGVALTQAARSGGGWPPVGDGPALAGFAHGAAGIARALDALARASGEARFGAVAESGRDYERGLFDGARGDWPVLVPGAAPGIVERRWMTSWCHGAPGVALDRALSLAHRESPAARAELDAASATLARAALPEVDHLCCGSAGRVTALAAAARWLDDEDRLTAARDLARRALARAESRGGWAIPTGGPDGERAELGFFRGYPGLAWTLVALTPAGAALPVVAALELPSERRRRRPT